MPPKRRKPFVPPKDVKAFWVAPHCGPGTLDPKDECGFCGRPGRECAAEASEAVAAHPDWLHDGCDMGNDDDDPDDGRACGGCGFWCKGCGRFWAQDSCGERFPGEMHAADGARQEVRDGKVYCVCGRQLARLREERP